MDGFIFFIWSSVMSVLMISCGNIQDPEFRRLEKFGVKKLSLQQTTIGFNATFYNPNSFTVNIKEGTFDLYLDSVFLGKFNQPLPVDVNKAAEFSIPLEGSISFMRALDVNLPQKLGREVMITANGSVKIGKAGVFIVKNVNYSGKHILDRNLVRASETSAIR
jgi:LEA14-like dessication related protein